VHASIWSGVPVPCDVPPGRKGDDATVVAEHRVEPGLRLEMGTDGERWYHSACSCGWSSEPCGTAVLAEAVAEQHVTMAGRPDRRHQT